MKLHASGEGYLETILVLQKKLDMIRFVDVARRLKISKPNVCHVMATLRDGGFFTMDEDHLPVQPYLSFFTKLLDLSLKWS